MTAIGFLIIALIVPALLFARRPAIAKRTLVFGAIIFIAPQTPWLTQILVDSLQKPLLDRARVEWDRSNVIVVLGAGVEKITEQRSEASLFTRSRTLTAAIAYKACTSHGDHCVVIASGGDPHKKGASEAMCMKLLLIDVGIPARDIELEERSYNTFENARYSAQIIRERFADSKIFVATSSLHMRRSLLYFEHFGIAAAPIVSEWVVPHFNLRDGSYNGLLSDLTLTEYWGIARFHIYNRLGWNSEPL